MLRLKLKAPMPRPPSGEEELLSALPPTAYMCLACLFVVGGGVD